MNIGALPEDEPGFRYTVKAIQVIFHQLTSIEADTNVFYEIGGYRTMRPRILLGQLLHFFKRTQKVAKVKP